MLSPLLLSMSYEIARARRGNIRSAVAVRPLPVARYPKISHAGHGPEPTVRQCHCHRTPRAADKKEEEAERNLGDRDHQLTQQHPSQYATDPTTPPGFPSLPRSRSPASCPASPGAVLPSPPKIRPLPHATPVTRIAPAPLRRPSDNPPIPPPTTRPTRLCSAAQR